MQSAFEALQMKDATSRWANVRITIQRPTNGSLFNQPGENQAPHLGPLNLKQLICTGYILNVLNLTGRTELDSVTDTRLSRLRQENLPAQGATLNARRKIDMRT